MKALKASKAKAKRPKAITRLTCKTNANARFSKNH